MAKLVLIDCTFTVGGNTHDENLRALTIEFAAEDVDVTNMDSAGWRELLGGIKSGTVSPDWVLDSDISDIYTEIFDALGTVAAFTGKLLSTTTSASNQEVTGSCLINSVPQFGGAVGEAFAGSVSWPTSGAVTLETS